LLWNGLQTLLRRHRLRISLIGFLSIVIWAGLFALFLEGFIFLKGLDANGLISNDITALLFGLFFLSVSMLTVFSCGLLLYGSLFRHPEAWFLLASPTRSDQIFMYKFREALLFAGWPFLLLGTPLLLAYGLVLSASWFYFLVFPLYLLGFLILPGAVGAMACLFIVTYASRHRKLVLAAMLTLFLAMVVVWIGSAAQGVRSDVLVGLSDRWARRLIDHLQPTRATPPGAWMTEGLLAAAQVRGSPLDWWRAWIGAAPKNPDLDLEPLRDACYYVTLVWAYGLATYLLAAFCAQTLYRRAFDQIAGGGSPRKKMRGSWSDRLMLLLVSWHDEQTRLFVLKDWRTFRRDPSQWGQVVLLGTIILIYLVNIQNLPHSTYPLSQRSLIGLLNVGVIGLMMATFTSRFIFPLMSLEGRNYWILGLLPLRREHLLASKFTYAATFTLTLSLIFVLLSGWQLRLPWPIMLMHAAAIIVLALGLSALSVGLGAYLVNLKEPNPSKIATGFGGTINLLICLGFSIAVVGVAGLPSILHFAGEAASLLETFDVSGVWWWQVGAFASLAALGLLAVWLPLRLGMRAFRKMEF
jgi:ABC-2 type transport system permease protein